MSTSPNRKAKQMLTAYKQNYFNSNVYSGNNPVTTQKKVAKQLRSDDQNVLNNIENQYGKRKNMDIRNSIVVDEFTKKRDKLIQELQKKVEIIQKHNSVLLAQNNALGQMLAEKKNELQIELTRFSNELNSLQTLLIDTQRQKNQIIVELEKQEYLHKDQISKLLQEISKLHDDRFKIQCIKNQQIKKLKETFEKQSYNNIQALKKSQNANIQLLETQIRKYKQDLDAKKYEIENINHISKANIDKVNQEIKRLNGQIKHITQMKDLELKQCKIHYQNEIQNQIREYKRNQQMEDNSNQNTIKKLKKQLIEKSLDIEKLINKSIKLNSENQIQLQLMKDSKEKLRLEIEQLEQQHRKTLKLQKQRLLKLLALDKQNLENTSINYANSLKSEIEKLYELTQYKTSQIKELHIQIENIRKNHNQELQNINKLNGDLKQKLNQVQLKNHQDLQLLKIKVAHLHQADVKGVRDYLQNQISILTQQNIALQKILQQNRQRIHKQLQQKNQNRKTFQVQLSKEKSKCYELKIKLATASIQMKQQHASMTSKLELASQTFIRDSKNKEKGTAFGQQQRRKLQHLIMLKDKQIKELEITLGKLKDQHLIEMHQSQEQILQLKKFIEELQVNQKKNIGFYQNQIKKKQSKFKQEIEQLKHQIENAKMSAYSQLKFVIQNLQKQNAKSQKEIQNYERQKKALIQQIAFVKGQMETVQLQSQAAMEDQRRKSQKLISKNEEYIKIYYDQKIKMKDLQIKALKEQLSEKQQDIRDIIIKYNGLQKRLGLLLESQEKLRDFENRILNLGMDNNLIKNLSELFRNRI